MLSRSPCWNCLLRPLSATCPGYCHFNFRVLCMNSMTVFFIIHVFIFLSLRDNSVIVYSISCWVTFMLFYVIVQDCDSSVKICRMHASKNIVPRCCGIVDFRERILVFLSCPCSMLVSIVFSIPLFGFSSHSFLPSWIDFQIVNIKLFQE